MDSWFAQAVYFWAAVEEDIPTFSETFTKIQWLIVHTHMLWELIWFGESSLIKVNYALQVFCFSMTIIATKPLKEQIECFRFWQISKNRSSYLFSRHG